LICQNDRQALEFKTYETAFVSMVIVPMRSYTWRFRLLIVGYTVSCSPLLIAWILNFDREDPAYIQACYDEDSFMEGQRRFGLFGQPV
jgi:hypothetical protein